MQFLKILNYSNKQRDTAIPLMLRDTWVLQWMTANSCWFGHFCDDVKSEKIYGRNASKKRWGFLGESGNSHQLSGCGLVSYLVNSYGCPQTSTLDWIKNWQFLKLLVRISQATEFPEYHSSLFALYCKYVVKHHIPEFLANNLLNWNTKLPQVEWAWGHW